MDAERSFNVIDNLIVEDAIENALAHGGLYEARANLNKAYDKIDRDGADDFSGYGNGQIEYTPQTEEGYLGLEPPLG